MKGLLEKAESATFHAEDVGKSVCKFLHTDFSIVDTVAGVKGIEQFHQIYDLACPAELLGRRGKDGFRCRQQPFDTHVEEFQLDGDDVRKFYYKLAHYAHRGKEKSMGGQAEPRTRGSVCCGCTCRVYPNRS